jgi:hypothetical protein
MSVLVTLPEVPPRIGSIYAPVTGSNGGRPSSQANTVSPLGYVFLSVWCLNDKNSLMSYYVFI